MELLEEGFSNVCWGPGFRILHCERWTEQLHPCLVSWLPFSCQCAAHFWAWQALTRMSPLHTSLFPAVSLCLFSAHSQPMLLRFSPADLAFCSARNWDRSESTQDQSLPHPSSPHSPEFTFNWGRWTFGQNSYFTPRWEWWGWGQQDQEC